MACRMMTSSHEGARWRGRGEAGASLLEFGREGVPLGGTHPWFRGVL